MITALEVIEIRLAIEEIGVAVVGQVEGVPQVRREVRTEAVTPIVLLIGGLDRQLSVDVRPPGQAWRQHLPLHAGLVDLGVGIVTEHHHPIEQRTVIAQRTAEVTGQLCQIVASGAHTHFIKGGFTGPLAHLVDDTARLGLAIEHRRRAPQHLGALHRPAVQARQAVGAARLHQAVAKHPGLGIEATNAEPVVTGVETVGHADAGGVAQRLFQGSDAACIHLLATDHTDRLWGFQQRGVSLGGGSAAAGDVTSDRSIGAFCRLGDHSLTLQFEAVGCRLRRRLKAIVALPVQHHAQATASQQLGKPLIQRVVPLQAGAAAPPGQRRIEAKQHTGLPGELGECRFQRAGTDLVRLRSPGRGRHRQQRQWQAEAQQCGAHGTCQGLGTTNSAGHDDSFDIALGNDCLGSRTNEKNLQKNLRIIFRQPAD